MKTYVKNNTQDNKKSNYRYCTSSKKGAIKLPRNIRNAAYHEAGHTLIGYLLGEGIDWVTIDPKKCTPPSVGATKYVGGETKWRNNVIIQMLFIAGILGQERPGQSLKDLLGAAEDIEILPYVGDESRDLPFINRNFRKEYPDLAKFCDVDRIVQAKIGDRLIELTKNIINEERSSLELIANSLLEKKTLTGQEIHDLLRIDEQAIRKNIERVALTVCSAIAEAIEQCKEFKKEEMKKFMMGQWRQ
jgi:hypothetical protein